MKAFIGEDFARKFVGLCVPPLVLALADAALTLLGQSEAYWASSFAVNEASPGFAALLKLGPWILAAGAVVWMLAFCSVIVAAPPLFALILSIAVSVGHTVGSGSWIFEHFRFGAGYQIANFYYLFSAVLIGIGARHAFPFGIGSSDNALLVDRGTRVLVCGVLFAAACLMFLVPLPQ